MPDGSEQWEVDKIVASRLHRGKLQYQADWEGWDPDPEWYFAGSFREYLKKFHDENLEQAGPPVRLKKYISIKSNPRSKVD